MLKMRLSSTCKALTKTTITCSAGPCNHLGIDHNTGNTRRTWECFTCINLLATIRHWIKSIPWMTVSVGRNNNQTTDQRHSCRYVQIHRHQLHLACQCRPRLLQYTGCSHTRQSGSRAPCHLRCSQESICKCVHQVPGQMEEPYLDR